MANQTFDSMMQTYVDHFWNHDAPVMPIVRTYYETAESLAKTLSYRWNDDDVDPSSTPSAMGMRRRATITVFVERGLREPAPLEIICKPLGSMRNNLEKLHSTIKLLKAVKNGTISQVEELLNQGAQFCFDGVHCETPLRNPICEALRKRRPALVEAMFRSDEAGAREQCRRCFHDAIRRGDIAHMESSIKFAGVNCSLDDWNLSSPCGRQFWLMMDVMPLHLAIAWDQIDAAIWLYEYSKFKRFFLTSVFPFLFRRVLFFVISQDEIVIIVTG